MSSVTFRIEAPAEILKKKGLEPYGKVQQYIDGAVLRYTEPFVPKKSGRLIASGWSSTQIGSGKISYETPYARYQYYGVSRTGLALKYHGGGNRGAFWFERMKAVYLQKILSEAAALAGGYPDISVFHPATNPLQQSQLIKDKFNFVPKAPTPQALPSGKRFVKIKLPLIQY